MPHDTDPDHRHDHGHEHDHAHGSELSDMQCRVRALETVLAEKGYIVSEALDRIVEAYESRVGPHIGAKVVARAWNDPAFKKELLADASKAVRALGIERQVGDADSVCGFRFKHCDHSRLIPTRLGLERRLPSGSTATCLRFNCYLPPFLCPEYRLQLANCKRVASIPVLPFPHKPEQLSPSFQCHLAAPNLPQLRANERTSLTEHLKQLNCAAVFRITASPGSASFA